MTDKEAMNVASQCRATAGADLCKNILVDGGSGFLFELLLDAAKAIETLAQEKALQALHNENERLGLYKDAYAEQEPLIGCVNHDCAKCKERTEQEPVAWIEKDMQCDDFDPDSVTCEKPTIVADGWEWVPLYTTPPQRKPLTHDELTDLWYKQSTDWMEFARAIEAKLKENT
jgi:hypothetical protein